MAKKRVLVVEDESIVAMDIEARLKSLGYAVPAVISSGEEAIEKTAEMRPDLVLMDIKLKGATDGVEAAEQIRARFDIPVVYLTAYVDDKTLQRAKVTEPFGYIVKPFEERELHTAIETALYKHEMERKLKESERWLAATLKSIGDAVIATDANGCITFMNPVAEALTGWRQKEAMGRELTEVFKIINEETRDAVENPVTRVLREGVVVGLANHSLLIAREGTEIPVDDSAAPIRDDRGNVTGVVLVFRDITERKQVEAALQESERRLRTMLDSMQAGVAVIDADTHIILDANPAAVEMIGAPKEKIVGQVCHRFICPAEEHKCPITDLGQAVDKSERVLINAKGERIPILKTVTPIILSGRRRLLESFFDITERKRVEEEKAKLQAQLLQSQKMEAIGILVGGVAHYFNNLMTVVVGYSDLLLDRLGEGDPLRQDIEKIARAGEQATALTHQLLALSRKQMLQPQVLNLNVVVTSMEELLRPLIGEDINLVTVLEPELARVKADLGQTEQVIMNLVVNARDAMLRGGRLIIKTENVTLDEDCCQVIPDARPGKFVRLSIADTGVGMDEEIMQHLFEPFFTTKEVGAGAGLGLAVVYGIVKQHEGWINVYSEPGQGSTFKVYLPAFSVEPQDETQETISLQEFQGRGERILLVEDEEGVREFATMMLRESGYVVFEAANAEEALDIFEREKGDFHLVFSDVVLPGRDGLELVDELFLRNPELRVMLSSGYSDRKARLSAIHEREFLFLPKPYSPAQLLQAIGEVMEPG